MKTMNSDGDPAATDCHCDAAAACNGHRSATRRTFLRAAGGTATSILLADLFPGRVHADDGAKVVTVATYPRRRIAGLSDVGDSARIAFTYPDEQLHTNSVLLNLNQAAGGGVGPNQSIVAYNLRCTHMGGDLTDGIDLQHGVAICREHLTLFDLTRHGIVVAGHATVSLPQIVLEIDGDDILAVGILGLIYGYHQNPISPTPPQ